MSIRLHVERAIAALATTLNTDGGIPATRPGEDSGAWTTASCLEALLICPATSVSQHDVCAQMARFLLDVQSSDGGWPLVNSTESCTMSTGHAVAALDLAISMAIAPRNGELEKARQAVARGRAWLLAHQNRDGGWGVQPSGGRDSSASRIVAIFYALRPFLAQGGTVHSSDVISRAMTLLGQRQGHNGGWPFFSGDDVDVVPSVSNTSRAISCVVLSEYCKPRSALVREALSYIHSERLPGSSWRLGIEGFYATGSNAQNIYHNNSPCDALSALLICGDSGAHVTEALSWLLESQREDGLWQLESPDKNQLPRQDYAPGVTWCTSEFIHTLTLALGKLQEESGVQSCRKAPFGRRWLRALFAGRSAGSAPEK